MKIEQDNEFKPITITLESREDAVWLTSSLVRSCRFIGIRTDEKTDAFIRKINRLSEG